jgi:hypothetical protein
VLLIDQPSSAVGSLIKELLVTNGCRLSPGNGWNTVLRLGILEDLRSEFTARLDGQPATHANGGTIGFACASAEQARAFHHAGVASDKYAPLRQLDGYQRLWTRLRVNKLNLRQVSLQ